MKLRYLRSFSVELGFRIPIISGIPDSLSCIPDSKAQYSGFHKQKFPRFRNPDSLTCGENQPYQLQTMSTTEKYGLSLIISPVKIVQQQRHQCGIGVKNAISRQQVRIPEERTLVLCCTFFSFQFFCFVLFWFVFLIFPFALFFLFLLVTVCSFKRYSQ